MSRVVLSKLIRSQTTQFISRNVSSGYNNFNLQTPTPYHVTNLYSNSCILTNIQKRYASQIPNTEDDTKITIGPRKTSEANENTITYHGPISSTIKKVKLLSLSTCCLSISLGPVITYMTNPDLNMVLKATVAGTVVFLSASTTAALHWFVSPYIHKIRWKPDSDCFEAEMLSWLAMPKKKTIRFDDIRVADTNRPFVSFKANGEFYFVDAENCSNKVLLGKLTPRKSDGYSAVKNS